MILGLSAKNRDKRGVSQRAPNVGTVARLSVPPCGFARRLNEVVVILRRASRISRAYASPAKVKRMDCRSRTKSLTSNCCSRARICRRTAPWVSLSSFAATVMLALRAAASNADRSASDGRKRRGGGMVILAPNDLLNYRRLSVCAFSWNILSQRSHSEA